MATDSKHLTLHDEKMGDSTEKVVPAPSAPSAVEYTRWQRFVSAVWDPDYYLKSEAERRLVRKLDTYMLSALCFGWLMKYIDQTNLTNAYVVSEADWRGVEASLTVVVGNEGGSQDVWQRVHAALDNLQRRLLCASNPLQPDRHEGSPILVARRL